MPRTSASRTIAVATPLGGDVLLLRSMSGWERLGQPFEYKLELVSDQLDIDPNRLLGHAMTLRIDVANGKTRYFNGHVSEFAQVSADGGEGHYRATLVPWLWFLSRTADCRIFQDMTAPDIIKKVFRDNGFSDFDNKLSDTYRTREYCVQYRETDFNFVSRLMEQEGIYYYFEHENGLHKLVLVDDTATHDPCPGYGTVKFYPPGRAIRDEEHIFSWATRHKVQPGKYVLNDYDFKAPKKALETRSTVPRAHLQAKGEIYDYPGLYTELTDGEHYVSVRIKEPHSQFEVTHAAGDARGIACGYTFKLANYPREDQCKKYLITSASYQIDAGGFASGEGGSKPFQCSFTAMTTKQRFRPARRTRKPVVQGPQTAVVCGEKNKEIWTDEFGRVKVQFHWDRYGKHDEKSSCWMRVAQIWAGKGWGAQFLPRIGHEVIVEFLEGDPDQPIVTGSVYNGDNKPPYALPAKKTQSGIKSRSSKDGSPANFNEIRFEDDKGKEEIHVHAERNLRTVVEENESRYVGDSRCTTIQKHETLTIKEGDRTETIKKGSDILTIEKGDRTETIMTGSETLTIEKGDRTTDIQTGNETLMIKNNRDTLIKDGHDSLILEKGDRLVDIQKGHDNLRIQTGDRVTEISKGHDKLIISKGNQSTQVSTGDRETKISSGNDVLSVPSGNIEMSAPAGTIQSSSKSIVLDATADITLCCGGSTIKLTPGEIKLESPLITINGGMVKINC